MIKAIDQLSCLNCGLCDDVCPMDVFRRREGKIYIAYPGDCCNCMGCLYICPVEAVILTSGIPNRFSRTYRWELIKTALKVKLTSKISSLF